MILAWILFSLYMLGTAWLGWLGYRRTTNFGSFAIGTGDLKPWVVGITLASSVASAATFIINPGFIYVHGLAGFMHFVVAVGSGFCLMLVLLSFRFRRVGEQTRALTMPHWIGNRYQSRGFALYFALVNLFALAFVVLIVGGLSIVMQQLLGLSNLAALVLMLTFVTGYIFLGGTYAHVFTNTLQGALMILVTVLILASGVPLLLKSPGLFAQLSAQDVNLIKWVNPASTLYNSIFSIYVSGFIIGAALVCQPHILTKALYVKSDRAVRRYLLVAVGVLILFFLLPAAGFYARLTIPQDRLIDAVSGTFRQDLVMMKYVATTFPGWMSTLISIVLLAAGMSTLDGILVSLSTISANDLFLNLIDRFGRRGRSEEERLALAYKLSHGILILIALVAFVICLDPPQLLGIFGQVGVYGMAVAAVPPLLAGTLFRQAGLAGVWSFSAAGLLLHFVLYFFGAEIFPGVHLAFANPGVPATIALLLTVPPALVLSWLAARRATARAAAAELESARQPAT